MHQLKHLLIILILHTTGSAQATLRFDPSTGHLQGDTVAWQGGQGWEPGSFKGCQITMRTTNQSYTRIYEVAPGTCYPWDLPATMSWLKSQIRNGVGLAYRGTVNPGRMHVAARTGSGTSIATTISYDVRIQERTSCLMDGPLVLDHGTLRENQVQGHNALTQARVTCDGPADVVVTGHPLHIKMTNGLDSKILVNGEDQLKVHVVGTATIDITSTLSGTSTQPGAATGTGVLQYEIQ